MRIVENLTAMLLGVHLFEEFAKHCGCELEDDLGVEAAVNAILEDVLETDHGVKNALDHFLEMLGGWPCRETSTQGPLRVRERSPRRPPRERLRRLPRALQAHRLRGRDGGPEGAASPRHREQEAGRVRHRRERARHLRQREAPRVPSWTLSKTKVVTADDFPTPEAGGSSGFRDNFKGRYGRDDS